METWEPKPPGTLWATPGLLRDSFTFMYLFSYYFGPFSFSSQSILLPAPLFQDTVLNRLYDKQ
jgi:hypothetical protein